MNDLVIRNGTVYDGSGAPGAPLDVAVTAGRISAIEAPGVIPPALQEMDAEGRVVTPGFIDTHSHLDGAVVWESRLEPNSGHGITTTVMGNCGVGFAPCTPEHRDFTVALMEGVEDIPKAVLDAGLPWTWETYPEYLAVLDGLGWDMDVAGLLPHSCLRVEAMGVERAIDGSAATAADLDTMAGLARDALAAGAIGIASTRLVGQTTRDGRPAPSRFATQDEFRVLADAIAEAGHGVLQIAPEFNRYPDALDELTMVLDVARDTGAPVTYSLKQTTGHPQGWRQLLEVTQAAIDDGVRVHPQVLARPTGAIIGIETSRNRFTSCPTYKAIRDLPLDERVARMREPDTRRAILDEAAANRERFEFQLPLLFPVGTGIDYEPLSSASVQTMADESGVPSEEIIYDHYLSGDGTGSFLWATGNYAEGNLDFAREMMLFEAAIPGLGDAGAHCSIICDASATTTTLAYWTRDRERGDRLPLEHVVHKLTGASAAAFGLDDRGLIEVGRRADLNIIDMERLAVDPPRMTHGLPTDGARLVQDAHGYDATLVAGRPTILADADTGERPGRLVRSS